MKFFQPSYLKNFFDFIWPIVSIGAIISLSLSLIFIINSPEDLRQGQWVKMIYFHVPCSWLSLLSYTALTIISIGFLSWKFALSNIFHKIINQIGTFFCILSIATGMLWGRFTWGVWWAWDARLTSMLVLLLFFLMHWIIRNVIFEEEKQSQIISILTILGFINLPIVKFSVDLWTSVHQKSSITVLAAPTMPQEIFIGIVTSFLALGLLSLIYFMLSFNCFIKDISVRGQKMQNYK